MTDDLERIGGISVQIGATHADLVSKVNEANRLLDALEKRSVTVQIGATSIAAAPARAAQGSVRPGAADFGGGLTVQSRGQAAQQRAATRRGTVFEDPFYARQINAALAKTSDTYNAITGEITKATTAHGKQRQAIIATQQVAEQPTKLNIDTAATQNDLNVILSTMREIEASAQRLGSLGSIRLTGGAAGTSSSAVTSHERATNTDLAARIGRAMPKARADDPELRRLTAQAAASAEGGALGSTTFAPPLSQAGRAALLARGTLEPSGQRGSSFATPLFDAFGGEEQAGRPSRALTPDDIARRTEARIAVAQAQAISSARTPRTLASSLGGFFGGGLARERIVATADLTEKEQTLREATRRVVEVEAQYGENSNATTKAIEEKTVAQNDYAKAFQRVEQLSTGTAAARNLLAITAAGAAFSVGMKAADIVITATTQALGNFIDIQTGFGATSTRVTAALATQTEAFHGNAQEALAAAEAQAGLSKTSADAISQQLSLTTQIKAGAQAQQQASELFRAASGVGNAPSGLFGGYGGVGGTALFAQQLGGGRGFTETIQQDLDAFRQQQQGGGQPNVLRQFNTGLAYVTNQAVRDAVNRAAGPSNPLVGISQAPGFLADLVASALPGPQGASAGTQVQSEFLNGGQSRRLGYLGSAPTTGVAQAFGQQGVAYINQLNDAAKRGASALNQNVTAQYRYTTNQTEIATAEKAAAQAGDVYGATLASQGIVLGQLNGQVASTGDAYKKLIEQVAVGTGITDTAVLAEQNLAAERQREKEAAASLSTIQAQQAYQLPSQIAAVGRQLNYGVNTQLPAQQALAGLANPNVPVGTGLALNPGEKTGAVAANLKAAQGQQDILNAKYAQGQQIIAHTYDPAIINNFSQAAETDFNNALSDVVATGKAIASISASVSNKQADYQTAQYNYQLYIAKRNLSDIGGLINQNLGAGESEYGVLERQNLLLSRQSQELQFALSQRQINFQVAQAGFVVPGVTPEERAANVKEAELEASFAQKQLNLQKQQFANQVKLVDIGNLRQGYDLVRQIGLLAQGRQVTIDTNTYQQQLLRLQQLQSQNVAKVSQYLNAVDNLTSVAFQNIATLEASAGKAMVNIATDVLGQFGIFINGLNNYVSQAGGGTGTGTGTLGTGGTGPRRAASGAVIGVSGPTRIGDNIIAGEAGNETLVILSHPRAYNGGGGSGGNTFVVNVNNPVVRSENDIDSITRKVIVALGRQGSLVGLRSVG